MLKFFSHRWDQVPTAWIDTETTGTRPGVDRACSVAIVRFENGKPVDSGSCLVDPGIPIPPEATAIHGITNEMASEHGDTLEKFFAHPNTKRLLDGAQPAAYNAPFDKNFVPPFGDDWTWPWLDGLSIVRVADRFERGKGRHRLEAAAARHGIKLGKAHDAESDARAAGELFYKLVPQVRPRDITLGALLKWQREREAEEWFRFSDWLHRQPPREAVANG